MFLQNVGAPILNPYLVQVWVTVTTHKHVVIFFAVNLPIRVKITSSQAVFLQVFRCPSTQMGHGCNLKEAGSFVALSNNVQYTLW
jgi:hypothetical protein